MEFHLESPILGLCHSPPRMEGQVRCVKKTFFLGKEKWGGRFVRGRHLFCVPSYTGDTRLSWLSSDYESLFQA